MKDKVVLCYGGIAMDSVVILPYAPKPGIAHIICEEYNRLGGGAAHVAEWLGSWNIPTRLAGYALGNDQYGAQLWKWLQHYPAIDLSHVLQGDEWKTLVSRSIPMPDGNRYLLCSDYAKAGFSPVTEALFQDVKLLEAAFYYRNEHGNEIADIVVRMAYERRIPITAMDIVLPEQPSARLAGIILNSAASIREQIGDFQTEAYCRKMHEVNHGVVIVTDGSRPVLTIDEDGSMFSAQPPTVVTTDTTGAGDSFRAGMIYGVRHGWPLERSLRWAVAVSALQVQRPLDQRDLPSEAQIAALAETIELSKVSQPTRTK